MSAEFEAFLQSKNISHTTSPAYAKAINGVAERRIGMATDIAQYYMLLSGAPPSFWPYAVTHASTALNLVTHGKSKIPPLEVITGCRQRVMNHLPFGCAAVVTKQVRERDNKLVARGVAGTFVGRSPDVIGSYLIWIPAHGKIIATANLHFDNESFPWVSGSNRHPPSILAANRLRLAAAHALRGEPLPTPQAPQWASSSNAAPTPPSGRPPVLHLFSGHRHPEDLASHLKLHGFRCLDLDQATGRGLDITDSQVLSLLVHDIADHSFSAVVLNPPSEPYSIVRHLDSGSGRPAALYTTAHPNGVPADTLSPADALTLAKSRQVLHSVVTILDACHAAGVPYILGGPSPRHDPSFMNGALIDPLGRSAAHGSLWTTSALVNFMRHAGDLVSEVAFAQCELGLTMQRYTSLIFSSSLSESLWQLGDLRCTHEAEQHWIPPPDATLSPSQRWPPRLCAVLALAIAELDLTSPSAISPRRDTSQHPPARTTATTALRDHPQSTTSYPLPSSTSTTTSRLTSRSPSSTTAATNLRFHGIQLPAPTPTEKRTTQHTLRLTSSPSPNVYHHAPAPPAMCRYPPSPPP